MSAQIKAISIIMDHDNKHRKCIVPGIIQILSWLAYAKAATGVCDHCNALSRKDGFCDCSSGLFANKTLCLQSVFHCRRDCGVCLWHEPKGRTLPSCYDHSKNCEHWRNLGDCYVNPFVMKIICKYSCGQCDCGDDVSDCHEWSKDGLCEEMRDYMLVHCKRSCGACACYDRNAWCKVWADNEQCVKNAHIMKLTCPLSCEVCGISPRDVTTYTLPPESNLMSVTPPPSTTRHHSGFINEVHCNNPAPHRFRRVVGGSEVAPRGSFPSVLGITSHLNPERVECGGTLLTDEFVLTAAHCFAKPGGMDSSLYTVRLGEHHLTEKEGFEEFIEVSNIFVHQLFSLETYDYDVAIVQLKTKVEHRDNVKPSCIASSSEQVVPRQDCVVAGWGYVRAGLPGDPPVLKFAHVPIADLADCMLKYGLLMETVTQRMICASGDGKADACQGDSGGPLFCPASDGLWKQFGIVSWGHGCGQKDLYGVYTNIGKLRSWIDETVATHRQDSPTSSL